MLPEINRRILIVDDNPAIHEDFKKILSSDDGADSLSRVEAEIFGSALEKPVDALNQKFEIHSAYQGAEAVEIFKNAASKNEDFSLVFMDVRMPPGIDGIEATLQIWKEAPATEVVICTAYSDYSTEEIVQKLGVSPHLLFLKKPFDAMAVKHMALSLTAKWSFERGLKNQMSLLDSLVKDRTKELMQSQERLIQSSKLAALGEMAAGLAHEVNNPLSIIALSAQQLREQIEEARLKPETLLSASDRISKASSRIVKIIKSLRSYSRDSEANNDPFEIVTIAKLIEEVVLLCSKRFADHNIEFKVINECGELNVECRPSELMQVLLNLLSNAFDAVENLSEKWISLKAMGNSSQIEIQVENSGDRIPSEISARIFDPFFTTKEVGKGTGLGLSIAASIMARHRGSLLLDATSKHTLFTLRLPTAKNSSSI